MVLYESLLKSKREKTIFKYTYSQIKQQMTTGMKQDPIELFHVSRIGFEHRKVVCPESVCLIQPKDKM